MGAPTVAVGDGALGFWAALADVFPETAEQRCWVHKTANILDALPKRLHRQAKAAIHEIYGAETRRDAIQRGQSAWCERFSRAAPSQRPGTQVVPARGTPAMAAASTLSAARSSGSRLCTCDLPHARASVCVSRVSTLR